MSQIQNTNDLLGYLIAQSGSGIKNWFGFQQQKIAGINLAYEMAKLHGHVMEPDEITEFVVKLNDSIYKRLIKGENI